MTAPQQGLDLLTFAQQLLTDVPARFASAGNPLPDRRMIIPGDPLQHAWDCEQFTVGLTGTGFGQAEDLSAITPRAGSPVSAFSVRHAVYSLQIVRCAPNVSAKGVPTPEQIQAGGEQMLRDAGLLSQVLTELVQELGGAPHARAGATNSDGVSGGYYGLTGSISITTGDLV